MRFDLKSRDRAFIIAECGTNHADNGTDEPRLARALRYVSAAQKVGANAVKFQWFSAPIQEPDFFCYIGGDEQRSKRWDASYMPLNDWRHVKQFADEIGIMLLASTFQHSTVEWLNKLELPATKVASRAAKNFPYDKAPQPYLISTGMDYPKFIGPGDPRAIYLECESVYPSTAVWTDRWAGFSDHSGTPWRAIDSIFRGCKLIEVHFMIDPADAGPDLPASLTLEQLALVCEARDAFPELRRN